jgi:peptidoglycan hydrolase-like protein with peptidoglycan-binding domain
MSNDIRKLIESVDYYNGKEQPLLEGKYGPHGKDLDKAIDGAISALGNDPTMDEIYAEVDKVKNSDTGGFFASKGYRETAALGAIAEKLGLPGLYRQSGKSFVSGTDRDDAGRPESYGNATKKVAQELAEKGYLSKEKAEKLGVMDFFGLEIGKQDDDDKAAASSNTSADAARKINRILPRIKELMAKMKETGSDETSGPDDGTRGASESFNFSSALGKALWESTVIMEALTADEVKELQDLIGQLETLSADAGEDLKKEAETIISDYKKADQEQRVSDFDKQADADAGMSVDYSSDEEVQKALADPEGYIENEMPKELKAANAKGILKATDRGKKKSASAAAVQKIMTQIGSVTGDDVYNIETDGMYGPASIKAVKAAQEAAGIKVDGDPGANTAAELVKFSKNPTAAGGIADKEVQQDIDRAIELFNKGQQEGGSGATAPGAQGDGTRGTENSSIDFRHLISIVEGKTAIMEALSDEEKEELEAIIKRLEPKLNDAEYMSSLEQSNKELADKFKALSDARKKYNDYVAKKKADDDKAAKDKEIADMKDHMDIAQGLYDAMKGGMLFGLGTDEQAVLALLGKLKDGNSLKKVETVYKSKFQADLMTHIEEEFSGDDLKQVMDIINKLRGGSEPTAGPDDGTRGSQGPADDVAAGVQGGGVSGGSPAQSGPASPTSGGRNNPRTGRGSPLQGAGAGSINDF